jgi:hypothetical protein
LANEKPLDLAWVQAWLAAWEESDLFSDAAVGHLKSLIPDNDCWVVVTRGAGRPPRSLMFRCWRRVIGPPAPGKRAPTWHDPDRMAMFIGPTPPAAAPIVGQLWRQMDAKPRYRQIIPHHLMQKVFRWDGTQWVSWGIFSDEATISIQGKTECSFVEALALAHELARWTGSQTIYTFDDSTWGNA